MAYDYFEREDPNRVYNYEVPLIGALKLEVEYRGKEPTGRRWLTDGETRIEIDPSDDPDLIAEEWEQGVSLSVFEAK